MLYNLIKVYLIVDYLKLVTPRHGYLVEVYEWHMISLVISTWFISSYKFSFRKTTKTIEGS